MTEENKFYDDDTIPIVKCKTTCAEIAADDITIEARNTSAFVKIKVGCCGIIWLNAKYVSIAS